MSKINAYCRIYKIIIFTLAFPNLTNLTYIMQNVILAIKKTFQLLKNVLYVAKKVFLLM